MKKFSICYTTSLVWLLWSSVFGPMYVDALENSRCRTPTMGWISSVAFRCDINEKTMHQQMALLASTGLQASLYRTFILGCGWQGTAKRTYKELEHMPVNTQAFPSKIGGLSHYARRHQLELGLTISAGQFACGNERKWKEKKGGSQGFLDLDIATFAVWRVKFLRVEFCYISDRPVDYAPDVDIKERFGIIRDRAKQLNRPMTLALDAWGIQNPAGWPIKDYANTWRIGGEVAEKDIWKNIVRTINQFAALSKFNKPGVFADLDVLMIGWPKLTDAEAITQFAFWAAAKSPLIICADLSKLSKNHLNVLTNKQLININQDPSGRSIQLARRYTNEFDVWSSQLSDNVTVVVLVNYKDVVSDLEFKLGDVGFSSARVAEVWTKLDLGTFDFPVVTTVAPHGVAVLLLNETSASPSVKYTSYPAIGNHCILYRKAVKRRTAKGVNVASNIGRGSYLEWHGIDGGTKGGKKLVKLDYIVADDVLSSKSDCPSCRNAWISVNDGPEMMVNFPWSGYTWDDIYDGYLIELNGFTAGATNKVKITNRHQEAPDFVALHVQST